MAWRHTIGGEAWLRAPRWSITAVRRCLATWLVRVAWFDRLFAVDVGRETIHYGSPLLVDHVADHLGVKRKRVLWQHVHWAGHWVAVRPERTLEEMGAPLTLRRAAWR
jgi:hypothetical protein